ncbi:MAG: LemA family protein [Pseudomonadota bacterium]
MMTWSLWSWLAPAVLVFWAVGAHNRLTRLRTAVLQAFAVLDSHLQGWIGLAAPVPVPEAIDPDAAQHHSDVADQDPVSATAMAAWAGLRAAALQLQACLLAARQRPLDRDRLAALSAARDVLRAAWRRLLADAPPVAGMPHAAGLHLLWDQGDTQVQQACDQFNQSVLRYNAAQTQFPAVILAWILRLSPARTL